VDTLAWKQPTGRRSHVNFALALAGIGAVYVLGIWIGVCLSEIYHRVDADRRALRLARELGAELDTEAGRWARTPSGPGWR